VSRAVSLLELPGEVVRKHERAPAGHTSVIPIVVDDLKQVIPVLVALCAVTEGRLFNTADPELQAPVPVTADPLRIAAITEALTGKPTTNRHVDLVYQGDSMVDAVFADPPTRVPSPGEQAVLAVARAVAHRDLDDHGLAVIAYRDNLIDLPFRRAIWRLAVDQLSGLRHSTLRTLVFVAETAPDVGLHCQTGRGYQLALDGERLLRRKGAEDLQVAVGQIARHTEPVVFFLGAGFSHSSRLPLGNGLRDTAIRGLLNLPHEEPIKSDQLAARFYALVSDHSWLSMAEQQMTHEQFINRLTLEQVIRVEQRIDASLPTLQEFRRRHDDVVATPGPAVLDLGAVLGQPGGPRVVIVEVNFDLLVETHTTAPLRVFATREEFADAPAYVQSYLRGDEDAVPLLKLHGTITDLQTCVVSAEQTELGIGQEKLEALRALLENNHQRLWVYVGASMRDVDLRPVFLHEEFGRGLDERWVSPSLAESVEEFAALRTPLWRGSGFPYIHDRIITETADAFFGALRAAWPTSH
jgi:hypothetical protein